MYVAHNSPAGHQHEQVGKHVLLLGVPERVCKCPVVLMNITAHIYITKRSGQTEGEGTSGSSYSIIISIIETRN